jgi:hypothetical protein
MTASHVTKTGQRSRTFSKGSVKVRVISRPSGKLQNATVVKNGKLIAAIKVNENGSKYNQLTGKLVKKSIFELG